MKAKHLLLAMIATICSLSLCSCSNDDDDGNNYVFDAAPIYFEMQVTDASGASLLDPAANAKFINDTYISLNGEDYPVVEIPESRAYSAVFYGLVLTENRNGEPCLFVGEFDGLVNTDDTSFTIHWGDGTTDVVSYSNKTTINGSDVNIDRHYYLNGEETGHQLSFIK